MEDKSRVSADKLDQILDEAAVTFPSSVDDIKSEVADVGAPTEVMMFFEEIQPGTQFDYKEELLNMAEQRTEANGSLGATETMVSDVVDEDDQII